MKFKTKEELIKEKQIKKGLGAGWAFNDGIRIGAELAFKSFAERKEVYKKYEGNIEYFTMSHKNNDWWLANKDKFIKLNNTMTPSSKFYEEHYALQNLIKDFNNWLFDYCFSDIK